MKVAINHYGRFECEALGLFLNKGDTFILTPKISKHKSFLTGIQRKKFEILDEPTFDQVKNAHGISDKQIESYREELSVHPEPEDEQEKSEEPEEQEKEEQKPVEEGDKTEEQPKTDGEEAKKEEADEEQIAFTEIAGNVDAALKAISKETDIEKLRFAALHDERKTVKAAIVSRIRELVG